MKTRLFVYLTFVITSAIGFLPTPNAQAHGYAAQCVIGFDDQFALHNIYNQARGTFAEHTGAGANGNEVCNSAIHGSCWTYREKCGSRGHVRVQEAPLGKYNHFHLLFEDDNLTCFASNGDGLGSGYGRTTSDGSCKAANWAKEPRYAAGHVAEHLIHIWVEDQDTRAPSVFELASIRITGTVAAKVWYKKSNGQWYFWSSLAPGKWNFSGYLWDITDVMLRAADGSATSVSFDDVVIRH